MGVGGRASRLYRGLDVLAAHKDKLCAHLMERSRDWFGVPFEFLPFGFAQGLELVETALRCDEHFFRGPGGGQ